ARPRAGRAEAGVPVPGAGTAGRRRRGPARGGAVPRLRRRQPARAWSIRAPPRRPALARARRRSHRAGAALRLHGPPLSATRIFAGGFRLTTALELISLALGGEAGARLARELGMTAGTSADALLCLLKAPSGAPSSDATSVRVLGVDDWAWRKGHTYGTILVDLERHRVPDATASRTAHPCPRRAAWLLTKGADTLTEAERSYAEVVCAACPALETVRTLAADFRRMLVEHDVNA